jgi:Flp pilus assembly protein TadG
MDRAASLASRDVDRGFVTVWTVALLTTFFLFVGFTLDAGRGLRARSDVFGVAAAAARTGAQEIDRGGAIKGVLRLDHDAATHAAMTYLADQDVTGSVTVTDDQVVVTASRTTDLQFFPGSTTATATATARVTGGP